MEKRNTATGWADSAQVNESWVKWQGDFNNSSALLSQRQILDFAFDFHMEKQDGNG